MPKGFELLVEAAFIDEIKPFYIFVVCAHVRIKVNRESEYGKIHTTRCCVLRISRHDHQLKRHFGIPCAPAGLTLSNKLKARVISARVVFARKPSSSVQRPNRVVLN